MRPPINLFEYEPLARERISAAAWHYFAGGANDELTLRDNRAAFERLRLRPRVLFDVSQRDLSTTVLGQTWHLPFAIAPMAWQALAHPDGELATARAADSVGATMILSTASTRTIEEVATTRQHTTQWFQLYITRDRGLTKSLVERARDAGYTALVVTVDTPIVGKRERDADHKIALMGEASLANFVEAVRATNRDRVEPISFLQFFSDQIDPSIQWKDLDWLASLSPMPILPKGILRADDAKRALDHGARGIIVSNHGGRQLDGAIATMDALSEVVDAVASKVDVLVDGGVRRGTDIVKAIALGAKAALLGRPVLWGLAVDGEDGARRVMELLRDEFSLAMALCGCAKISEIDQTLVKNRSVEDWRMPAPKPISP
jgi:4-hydroxymandelate oxidase